MRLLKWLLLLFRPLPSVKGLREQMAYELDTVLSRIDQDCGTQLQEMQQLSDSVNPKKT